MPTFQPVALSITNVINKSNQTGWQFPAAGRTSDFDWWIFAGLAMSAFSLCALNFFFLRRHEVSRQQMESDRRYEIYRQHRSVAAYRFPCWVRILGNLACKIGFVILAYSLVSAQGRQEVWAGVIAAMGFIGFNVRCILRELLHPRSVLHRRFLFYRADPTFIRTRLLFELIRRFVYFIIGFAFLSYALHRLTGNEYMFAIHQENVSLFLQHLESALSGMTSFGNDPVAYANNMGMLFHIFRALFVFVLLVTFANLMLSGMSSSGQATEVKNSTQICLKESDNGLDTKNDVAAMVELVIENHLRIPSIQIKPESDLILDLGADSLDMAELQMNFEQAFECEVTEPDIFSKITKVGEFTDLFWELTRKEALAKEFDIAGEQ